jgi:hypothetical protein
MIFIVPTLCHNEVLAVESFQACFMRRYNSCPAFFMGSLQDACQAAFASSAIEKVRLSLQNIEDSFVFSLFQCSSTYIMTKTYLVIWFVRKYSVQRLLLNIYLKTILSGHGT